MLRIRFAPSFASPPTGPPRPPPNPHPLADGDPDAPVAHGEDHRLRPPAEVAHLVEDPVVGKVHLAVDAEHPPPFLHAGRGAHLPPPRPPARFSSTNDARSSRSSGGYPGRTISGKTTRCAPASRARPHAARTVRTFPAMSPTGAVPLARAGRHGWLIR